MPAPPPFLTRSSDILQNRTIVSWVDCMAQYAHSFFGHAFQSPRVCRLDQPGLRRSAELAETISWSPRSTSPRRHQFLFTPIRARLIARTITRPSVTPFPPARRALPIVRITIFTSCPIVDLIVQAFGTRVLSRLVAQNEEGERAARDEDEEASAEGERGRIGEVEEAGSQWRDQRTRHGALSLLYQMLLALYRWCWTLLSSAPRKGQKFRALLRALWYPYWLEQLWSPYLRRWWQLKSCEGGRGLSARPLHAVGDVELTFLPPPCPRWRSSSPLRSRHSKLCSSRAGCRRPWLSRWRATICRPRRKPPLPNHPPSP